MPIWRPTVAFTDSNASSCWLSTSVVLSIQMPSYRLGKEWSSLHQWAYKLNRNCQDDHNLLSILKPLSHFLQGGEAPLALHYKLIFLLPSPETTSWASPPHWISNGLYFFPQDLNLYLFLLNITLFKNLLNFDLPWLLWIIQCKLVYSIRLDLEIW